MKKISNKQNDKIIKTSALNKKIHSCKEDRDRLFVVIFGIIYENTHNTHCGRNNPIWFKNLTHIEKTRLCTKGHPNENSVAYF